MAAAKKSKNKGRFAGVPLFILESDIYVNLPNLAKVLLFELCAQYNGYNNGYLSLSRIQLKGRGINSPEATKRAIDNLVNGGLITKTRQGGAARGKAMCSLYALNWQTLDEKMDKPLEHFLSFKGSFKIWFDSRSQKVPILVR